jgi:hypothetical protein
MTLQKLQIHRQKMERARKRGTHRAMISSLRDIRLIMRRNILRRRKSVSEPGKPPSVRSKEATRTLKFVLYAFDPATETGVVGSVFFPSRNRHVTNADAVPGTLEKGGSVKYHEVLVETRLESYWLVITSRTRKLLSRGNRKTRRRRVQIRPRPYAIRALERADQEDKIADAWRNVITD